MIALECCPDGDETIERDNLTFASYTKGVGDFWGMRNTHFNATTSLPLTTSIFERSVWGKETTKRRRKKRKIWNIGSRSGTYEIIEEKT